MPAPKEIIELIDRFDRNIEAYKSGKYNETQLRREFLDPLFEALGWDVNNKNGYTEAYKDVIHEDSIKVGAGTKAPDYCFRLGGMRKFFLEAKKPSVDIKNAVSPAYQIRRYAWSAKLPLSILSDFEEFAVYDCRVKPSNTDKSSVARILFINYKDYIDRWDEISAIFSKEAIQKGSFDKFIGSGKKKRGTTEVDDVFLEEIESWREMLAKDIAKHNPRLTQRELNFAVQRTIDRIIFLRICEDRGIEEYGRLMALQNGGQVYSRLCELFKHADEKYNSGLFHFHNEKNIAEQPDELTLRIKISDEPLKDIIKRLYFPDSPYEFSIISADILGQVYEQFLGKVIRLTDGHRAIVEEKPEVRKAGGIYYTPSYIVDYIVKNTVGKLLERKNPKTASKLRILDPACGSGHFLIGAYQYLLDWHLNWYVKDGAKKWAIKKSPILYQDTHGEWRLTTSERKRILLNNIYGVDIDPQAVEVTKLSLLLKVLEGETEQTLNSTLRLFHERALPDLGNNIKCGNSLIGPDFYDNQQVGMFNEEERYRINAFDWQAEFPEIMEVGGFDAVIGNPPYINAIQLAKLISVEEKNYWKNVYLSAKGAFDIYIIFFEKSLNIAKSKGYISFITPNKYLSSPYGTSLRALIAEKYRLVRVVDLSDIKVFNDPMVYPIITVLNKIKSIPSDKTMIEKYIEKDKTIEKSILFNSLSILPEHLWGVILSERPEIVNNIYKKASTLDQVAVVQATSTAAEADEYSKYIFSGDRNQQGIKIVNTGTIDRYCTLYGNYDMANKGKSIIDPVLDMKHISVTRKDMYLSPKVIVAKLALRIESFLDEKGEYASINTNCIYRPQKGLSLKYIIALLNSRLMSYIYSDIYSGLRMGGGYFQFQAPQLRNLPILIADNIVMDELIGLVDLISKNSKQLLNAQTPHDKESVQRRIETTDNRIDKLVYALYGLTEEEIRVVEGKK